MSIGLIGTKIGMTREFLETGQSIPVTVIKVEKGRVLDIIPKEKSDAFSKAPPTNMLNSPNNVSCNLSKAPANEFASTPGMGI